MAFGLSLLFSSALCNYNISQSNNHLSTNAIFRNWTFFCEWREYYIWAISIVIYIKLSYHRNNNKLTAVLKYILKKPLLVNKPIITTVVYLWPMGLS